MLKQKCRLAVKDFSLTAFMNYFAKPKHCGREGGKASEENFKVEFKGKLEKRFSKGSIHKIKSVNLRNLHV